MEHTSRCMAASPALPMQSPDAPVLGGQDCIAVAAADHTPFDERGDVAGPAPSYAIMVWCLQNMIQPRKVLSSPEEVWAFQFNPLTPTLVAAGCHNGQVLLWDLAAAPVCPLLMFAGSTCSLWLRMQAWGALSCAGACTKGHWAA